MTDENLQRLRTTRAGNNSVVTKLIAEAEEILHGPYQLEEKTRNRLTRIEKVLKEKTELIQDLDEKIIAVCKVEDIEEEIENAEDLKMRVMDAIEAISTEAQGGLIVISFLFFTFRFFFTVNVNLYTAWPNFPSFCRLLFITST